MIRVGINGYGRIGRNVHRQLIDHPHVEIVAINTKAALSMRMHLLQYDSIHGKLNASIEEKNEKMVVNGREIRNFTIRDANDIPWAEEGADIVLEATGKAKTQEIASRHFVGGAKKVLVSAPMKDDTPTVVCGVNDEIISGKNILSNASCTTNCISPILKVLQDTCGVQHAFVTSVHSFTHSQNLLDNSGRDFRRARAATMSVIPTTSGAMAATSKVIPELEGKVNGLAFRVPIATSSVCEMSVYLEKPSTKETLNEFFREKSKEPHCSTIIEICEEELVSIDFKTNPHSVIVDASLTKVSPDGHHAQFVLWYDNEWGYATRLCEVLEKMGN